MVRALSVIGAVVLTLPLMGLALASFQGTVRWQGALNMERLWRTFAVGIGATELAMMIGVPAGFVLALSRPRIRRVLLALTLIPLMVPPGLAAIEWIALGLPVSSGEFTVAVVLGTVMWPIFALFVLAGVLRIDAASLEAATLHLSRWRVFHRIVWPQLRRPVFEAFGIVFLLAVADFSVAGTFGVGVQSMEILQRMQSFDGAAGAVAAALPHIFLGLAIVVVLRAWPAVAPAPGMRTASATLWLGPTARRICWAVAGIAWIATALVPSVAVFATMGSPAEALLHHGEKAALTVWTAAAAAVALVIWASLGRPSPWLEKVWIVSLVLPGVLVAMGVLELASHAGVLRPMRESGALLVIAYAARYAFIAAMGIQSAVASVPRPLLEAARLSGMSRWRTWRAVVLPHIRPRLLAVAGILFVLCLGEISPAVLLSPLGNETVMLRLFSLMHYGYDDMVATLAGLHLLAVWIVMLPLALARGRP